MTQCPLCNEYYFMGKHQCAPSWECIRLCDGEKFDLETEDSTTIYAVDARSAAESFVAKQWRYENADVWKVCVRPADDFRLENWQAFEVTVEFVPSFTADLVTL